MLLFSFLFGMVGGWVVHVLVEYRRGDNAKLASKHYGSAVGETCGFASRKHNPSESSLSEKPEWEEVRKIPGQIFLTVAIPVMVMGIVSKDEDLAGGLILICMVVYAVFRFLFYVVGEFLPWGPEGSITARKRMIRAAKLYLHTMAMERRKPVSLRIEETKQTFSEGPSVQTLRTLFEGGTTVDDRYHTMVYGRTGDGMTQKLDRVREIFGNARILVRRNPEEMSDLPKTEDFQCCLCHPDPENEFHRFFRWQIQESGEKGKVIFALSDLDELVDSDISEERKTELKARNAEYRRQYGGNVDALLHCPANHFSKTSGDDVEK